ncbi:MAG: phosphatase PAP2 family protein [Alphaproteobacteria bacterium]|nr:phosphatase PAP2 family protein [Alphaproteobacteria bacterium]
MFIRKDNTLKWDWIAYAAIITLALVLVGLFGLDKEIYSVIHPANCNPFTFDSGFICSVAVFLGKIFRAKLWLGATAFSVLFFFIYKAVTNENDFRYAFVKIKNSYVFYVFSSVLLACITTGVLKVLIGRSRPVLFDALGQTMFVPGTFEHVFNSMPSGHTAASFAGLVMIGMLFPKIKWATWTLAILIGVSRLYVGAHWFSDVIFGAFIGMVCADIVKAILKKINSK